MEAVDKLWEKGCFVVAVFWDDFSGSRYDRPGLKAAREYAKRHLAQGIAVWLTNRFGRAAVDGMVLGRDFSREGCPVWFRLRPSYEFKIADHNRSDQFQEFANQLFEAEADLNEHKDKIERGQRGKLRRGEWPHGSFRRSIFYEAHLEGEGRDRCALVQTRPQAQETMDAALAFLEQEAGEAALQAIADTLGIRLRDLVAELESRLLEGILDTRAIRLDDNVHERLRLVTAEENRFLQECLKPVRVRFRRKAANSLGEALRVASPTELHIVSKRRIAILCRCGKICTSEFNGEDAFDREVWRCPAGHKNRVVPDAVRHGLALDNKTPCPKCGRYEKVRRMGRRFATRKIDGEWYVGATCGSCGAKFYCTHEVEPSRKRHLKDNFAPRGQDATKVDRQRLISDKYGKIHARIRPGEGQEVSAADPAEPDTPERSPAEDDKTT